MARKLMFVESKLYARSDSREWSNGIEHLHEGEFLHIQLGRERYQPNIREPEIDERVFHVVERHKNAWGNPAYNVLGTIRAPDDVDWLLRLTDYKSGVTEKALHRVHEVRARGSEPVRNGYIPHGFVLETLTGEDRKALVDGERRESVALAIKNPAVWIGGAVALVMLWLFLR